MANQLCSQGLVDKNVCTRLIFPVRLIQTELRLRAPSLMIHRSSMFDYRSLSGNFCGHLLRGSSADPGEPHATRPLRHRQAIRFATDRWRHQGSNSHALQVRVRYRSHDLRARRRRLVNFYQLDNRIFRLEKVLTTTGAQRFENEAADLIWIAIPTKGILLDGSCIGSWRTNASGTIPKSRKLRSEHKIVAHESDR